MSARVASIVGTRYPRAVRSDYVHGYGSREAERLVDQASAVTGRLHGETRYPAGARVLEAGCGVGAQTVTLAMNSPGAHIVSIDLSPESLDAARERTRAAGVSNVVFQRADIYTLPFAPASFDHVFACFVLEHVPRPTEALIALRRVLKPGGTLTVFEGDHGSTYFQPDRAAARQAIACLVELQARAGGNSLIGRSLYPLVAGAGFRDVVVTPHMIYVDASRPQLVEGFTRRTFTAMVEGVGERALAEGLIDEAAWRRGIRDLYRTAEPDGTFCYTFFKALGRK